jgi:hypothetical protein
MRFTVTSWVGVTEVADRPESGLFVSTSSCYSGVSEAMFASLMRTGWCRTPAVYAGWQPSF